MKTPLLLIGFLVLLSALAGCESTPHYKRTKVVAFGAPLPKRPYGTVKFYESKEQVTQPYDVIAILSVDGRAGEEAAFFKAFLYRAADLGADGVIASRVSVVAGTEGGAALGMLPISPSQTAAYRGEVIRFK